MKRYITITENNTELTIDLNSITKLYKKEEKHHIKLADCPDDYAINKENYQTIKTALDKIQINPNGNP